MKKVAKKLTLNKGTVSELNEKAMSEINGGTWELLFSFVGLCERAGGGAETRWEIANKKIIDASNATCCDVC